MLSEQGKIWFVGSHRNGKLHGKLTEYHPNGQKASEMWLKDGNRCGKYVSWSDEGKIIDTGSFRGKGCGGPRKSR